MDAAAAAGGGPPADNPAPPPAKKPRRTFKVHVKTFTSKEDAVSFMQQQGLAKTAENNKCVFFSSFFGLYSNQPFAGLARPTTAASTLARSPPVRLLPALSRLPSS
jgi:hypothetical protein